MIRSVKKAVHHQSEPEQRRTLRVGVTGGIGSGKSVVCGMFRDLGIRIIEADCLAKQLMENDPPLRSRIASDFGASSYREDGSLDRPALAKVIFNDPQRRKQLEALVHPRVRKAIDDFFTDRAGDPYAIVEAALIYESGLYKELDYVVVVDAEEEASIRRVVERDGGTKEEIRKRIDAQMSADEKRGRADFTIVNNGTRDDLRSRVAFINRLLAGIASRPAPYTEENAQ